MRSRILKTAAVLFLFVLPFSVFAQTQLYGTEIDDEAQSEEILINEDGVVEDTWQILEWEESEPQSVLFYGIIIEELNKRTGTYTKVLEARTEGNETSFRIQPLLPLGEYRYKVVTYNLLGIAEAESDFCEFSIVRAYKPRVTGVSSAVNGTSTIYMEEDNDGVFNVSGRNLFFPGTEYALVKKGSRKEITPQILNHEKSNRALQVQFDMESLDAGVYSFVAIDASGLKNDSTKSSEITIKFKKWYDIDLSGGYACPIVIYDNTINEYMGSKVWPIGFNAKAVFIFSKHKFGYLGVGMNSHFNHLNSKMDFYSIEGNIFDTYLDFVFQKPLYKKAAEGKKKGRHFMTLEARAGVGLMLFGGFVFKFNNGVKGDPLNGVYFSLQGGASAQFFITNRFFVEAGFDYVHAFAGDIMLGEIIPCLSAGWQF